MEVRLPGRRTVVTRPYPHSDPAFAAEVYAALSACREQITDADELRVALNERLRAMYPNTRIVAQEPMASLVTGEEVWYVYRDAAVRRPDERRDRLYGVLSAARRTIAASHAAVGRGATLMRRADAGVGRRRGAPPANGQLRLDDLDKVTTPSAPRADPDRSDPQGA